MLEFNWDPFPELQTKRLHLKRIQTGDLHDLYKLRSEEESMKYIGRPLATCMNDAKELMDRTEQMFNNKDGINWAIKLKGNDVMIGTIGFYRMKKEHFRAEVGYQLQKEYLRLGYMYEALNAVVNYGFANMKLHVIEADVNPDNIASGKLLEKSDFELSGFFKESFFFEGVFYDSVIYTKLSPFPFL